MQVVMDGWPLPSLSLVGREIASLGYRTLLAAPYQGG